MVMLMVVVVVVVMASPKQAQNRSQELSRGLFCAALHAEREYGNEALSGARLGLVLDECSS
eukprot:8221175-Alexandrium_andersonii.AAC.1